MKKSLTIPQAIEYYVAHRRQMGFAFEQEGKVLSTLAEYARHTHHRGPLTRELVLDWAQLPTEAAPHWWARRLAIARRFAQFWVAFDPRTQLPPAGVFGSSHHRPGVHLYTEEEIAQLLAATAILGPADSLRVATFHTLFGLLACTGLRISEALRLQPHDLNSPHILRHTTAMHRLQAGNDITVIALWMGHETPATTHQYLELDLHLKEQGLQNSRLPPWPPPAINPRIRCFATWKASKNYVKSRTRKSP